MDVEAPPDISEYPPISSSSPHVIEFENEMKEYSELLIHFLLKAGSNKKKLQDVLSYMFLPTIWMNLSQSDLKKNVIDLSVEEDNKKLIESLNDREIEEWKSIIQKGDWTNLIMHPKLRKPAEKLADNKGAEKILHDTDRLGTAYMQDLDSATKFIAHLELAEEEDDMNQKFQSRARER